MNLRTCFTSYLTHTARASMQLFKIVFPDSDVHNYYDGFSKKDNLTSICMCLYKIKWCMQMKNNYEGVCMHI